MSTPNAPLPVDDIALLRRRRSAKWRSFPCHVLPLPVAEMDFSLAPPVAAALHAAVDASDTGYSMVGDELGESLTGFARDRWAWHLDAASVVPVTDVGVGAVELLRVMCSPGDSVVVNPPVYAPFFSWLRETHTQLIEAPLRQDGSGRWRLDLDALEDAFRQRPAVYILCSPHNPVGRVHNEGELASVVALAQQYDVRVISDEIHGPLVLPGARFTPLLSVPGAEDVAVSLLSASKGWNLAGLKCALVVSAPPMRSVVDRLPPDGRWRIGHFGALATVAAFEAGGPWLDALLATLDLRRSELGLLLADHLPEVRWQPPEATYLAWLDCRRLGSGEEPRALFLDRALVGLEPGPAFGAPGSGHVRLNFGTSAEILGEAVRRMGGAVDDRCRADDRG